MTKRTEIAVRILQGLAANPHVSLPMASLVSSAFQVADLVLEEEAKSHVTPRAPRPKGPDNQWLENNQKLKEAITNAPATDMEAACRHFPKAPSEWNASVEVEETKRRD